MMKTKLFVYVLLFIVPIRFSIAYGELEGEWICDIKVNDSVSLIMPSTSDIPFNISISVNGDPSNSVGIAWFTNPHIDNSEVLYIKKGDRKSVVEGKSGQSRQEGAGVGLR